jgi:hypothetical protein
MPQASISPTEESPQRLNEREVPRNEACERHLVSTMKVSSMEVIMKAVTVSPKFQVVIPLM